MVNPLTCRAPPNVLYYQVTLVESEPIFRPRLDFFTLEQKIFNLCKNSTTVFADNNSK